MSTIGSISLQSDENGLVTLQCDRCESRFKIDCEYLNFELDSDICCPVCGIHNSLNTFYPIEVVEESKKVVIMEAEKMISQAFKGINSKFIKVKTQPVNIVDTHLSFKNKDYDMQIISIECCSKKVGLNSIDSICSFYCPYCGRII